MTLPSGTRFGPYEILSPLGAGGMGEVYRAKDTRLDRTVAIKVLPTHLSADPELKQRMEREAKAISALQHSNICTLYDIGTQDGTDFLVMEYLEGQTLAERLKKGPLPLDQVLKIGIEIAQALEKAHQRGIIHRDLKPANIMLTKAGAKLMDFGLAKPKSQLPIASQAVGTFTPSTPTMNLAALTSAASPLTQKGSIVGTFQYMAPELLQGAEADARSDLFSFGCVLYEMITGRRAFEGKSQLSVFSAILEKDPEPISATQPLAPPMLDRVVGACLAKDPADRFQSAHDVAMDLRWIESQGAKPADAELAPAPAPNRLLWFAAVAAAIVLGTLAGFFLHRPAVSSASIRAVINPPPDTHFRLTSDVAGPPVLSPDGAYLAFTATGTDGKTSIWVRPMNGSAVRYRRCHLPFLVAERPFAWILRQGQTQDHRTQRHHGAVSLRRPTGTRRHVEFHWRDCVFRVSHRAVIADQRQRRLSHSADKSGSRAALLPPLAVFSSRWQTLSLLRDESQSIPGIEQCHLLCVARWAGQPAADSYAEQCDLCGWLPSVWSWRSVDGPAFRSRQGRVERRTGNAFFRSSERRHHLAHGRDGDRRWAAGLWQRQFRRRS